MTADAHLYPRTDELGVLGACLLGGLDSAVEMLAELPLAAVFADDVRDCLSCVERLVAKGDAVNEAAIARDWAKAFPGRPVPVATLSQSLDACPSSANGPWHAQNVRDGWRRRRVIESATLLASRAKEAGSQVDELIAEAEALLAGQETDVVPVLNGKAAAGRFLTDVQARFDRRGSLGGITSGFPGLDSMTDGLQPGEQAVIAARPSIGKTAIGLNILETACLDGGIPTLFVSLEMRAEALLRRLCSSSTGVPVYHLRNGDMDQGDFAKVARFNARIASSAIHIADGIDGLNIAQISACVRRAARKHGVKLVIVDYLQKIQPTKRHEKRTYEVAEVSGRLKAIAAKTGVAMVTLAQLNRESEKEKRAPRLGDLADSGQIERDADLVGLLHRERSGPKQKEAMLIVAKQRDGETGVVRLNFDGSRMKFTQASQFED